MKQKTTLFFLILLLFSFNIYAHPGRTDSVGGHTNHSTGEYHYHHGYPEHQHLNGVCPYEEKNNENSDSYGLSITNNDSTHSDIKSDGKSKPNISYDQKMILIYTSIGVLLTIIHIVLVIRSPQTREKNPPERKTNRTISFSWIIGVFVCVLFMLSMFLFAYWTIYATTYKIAQYLIRDDVIIMNLLANTPTWFILYFLYKDCKE